MDTCHWLWPTLVFETSVQTDNLMAFNTKLLALAKEWKADTKTLWELETPVTQTLKQEFLRSSIGWLTNADLPHLIEHAVIGHGWLNIYQPGQMITPHFHGNLELVNLYYLTDEDENNPIQLTLNPHQPISKKPGHTAFQDPRGSIELREKMGPSFEVCPKQGRILTWAGHLQHWTLPTNRIRAIIGCHTVFPRYNYTKMMEQE